MSHSLFSAQALVGADLRQPWPHAQRKKTNSFVALFLHIHSPLLTLHQPADLAMSVQGAIVVKNNLHETLRNDAMAKTPSQTAFIGPRIEPLLMVLHGFDVGGLILAMYLPIFAIGDLFHS